MGQRAVGMGYHGGEGEPNANEPIQVQGAVPSPAGRRVGRSLRQGSALDGRASFDKRLRLLQTLGWPVDRGGDGRVAWVGEGGTAGRRRKASWLRARE